MYVLKLVSEPQHVVALTEGQAHELIDVIQATLVASVTMEAPCRLCSKKPNSG